MIGHGIECDLCGAKRVVPESARSLDDVEFAGWYTVRPHGGDYPYSDKQFCSLRCLGAWARPAEDGE